MQRFYIIDTFYFIFKSFYAINQNLTTSTGFPTNAVFGVLSSLQTLVRELDITHCVAALESQKPVFRKELDCNYKANRPPVPDSLDKQIPVIIEMLEHLGIKSVSCEGYEADDVIGTLAHRAAALGVPVSIISNDKDLAQILACPGDIELVHTPHSGKCTRAKLTHLQHDQIFDAYGVPPELIADFLALMGDSSDNIIGVRGIGPKTAAKLLNKSGGLAALLDNPQQAGKFAPALVEQQEQLRLNLELSRIHCDLELPWEIENLESLALQPLQPAARDFFAKLDMHGFIRILDNNLFATDFTLHELC